MVSRYELNGNDTRAPRRPGRRAHPTLVPWAVWGAARQSRRRLRAQTRTGRAIDMEPPQAPDEKDFEICIRVDRNEVHYIIAAPPAYHASLDGFKDPTVQETIEPKEMTMHELKKQLLARGLPTAGKKSVLVKRLNDFRENQLNFKGFFTELRKAKQQCAGTSAPQSCLPSSQTTETESPSSSQENGCCSPNCGGGLSSRSLSVKPVLRKETAIRPHELTVVELRRHLSSRGIPVSGKAKQVLASELKDILKEERKRAIQQRTAPSSSSTSPLSSSEPSESSASSTASSAPVSAALPESTSPVVATQPVATPMCT